MTDLNSLIPPNSPLYLLHAFGINSAGEIVGFALQISTGEIHAYLAIPIHAGGWSASSPAQGVSSGGGTKVGLPENARKQLRQWLRFGRFGYEPPDPCDKYSTLSPNCKAN